MNQLWAVKHGGYIWWSYKKDELEQIVRATPGTYIEKAMKDILSTLQGDGFKVIHALNHSLYADSCNSTPKEDEPSKRSKRIAWLHDSLPSVSHEMSERRAVDLAYTSTEDRVPVTEVVSARVEDAYIYFSSGLEDFEGDISGFHYAFVEPGQEDEYGSLMSKLRRLFHELDGAVQELEQVKDDLFQMESVDDE